MVAQRSAEGAAAAFDNGADLEIAFDKGDVVRIGQSVSYRVTAHQDGYLLILDQQPDG